MLGGMRSFGKGGHFGLKYNFPGRSFHSQRLSKWDELFARSLKKNEENQKKIQVVYQKEGKVIKLDAVANITTPQMLFDEIKKQNPSMVEDLKRDEILLAELEGKPWDLTR